MSCDRTRARYFGQLAARPGPLWQAFGDSHATAAALDVLYDVARNQAPPSDPAAQARVQAAYQAFAAEAEASGVRLHPHPKPPKLEVQYAWSVVAATLKAVEGGAPLPPLAEDVRQTIGYQHTSEHYIMGWGSPISPATRQALRQSFASRPDLVATLVEAPLLAGHSAFAPLLADMSQWLADDTTVRPSVAAAARHYLALDEAEMLGEADRAEWARVLAACAHVGIIRGGGDLRTGSPVRYTATYCCPKCGRMNDEKIHSSQCISEERNLASQVAVAVARVIADPLYEGTRIDGSPFTAMDRLLDPWLRAGAGVPPNEAIAALVQCARYTDVALARYVARELSAAGPLHHDDEAELDKRFRDATLRTPVIFEGQPYIWEHGKLYEAGTYRGRFAWDHRTNKNLLSTTQPPFALLPREHLARLMAGEALDPQAIRLQQFPGDELLRRYPTVAVEPRRVQEGDVFPFRCGCVYTCKVTPGARGPGLLERSAWPASGYCPTHQTFQLDVSVNAPGTLERVDLSRPLFPLPTWP